MIRVLRYMHILIVKPFMRALIALFVLAAASVSLAEPIVVGVSTTVANALPEKTKQLKSALRATGLPFQFIELPNERVLRSLSSGHVDMDLYRHQSAMTDIEAALRIPTPVDTKKLYLVTHSERPELCDTPPENYPEYSMVGVIGARFFDNFIYPKFKSHTKVINFDQAMQLIDLKRADFSVWDLEDTLKSIEKTGIKLGICDKSPILELAFHSYIHVRLEQHLDIIDRAYRNTLEHAP